jgi:hypothetical protein
VVWLFIPFEFENDGIAPVKEAERILLKQRDLDFVAVVSFKKDSKHNHGVEIDF